MTTKEFRKARHKYNAQKTERDGIKFPSLLEARYFDRLVMLQKSGGVVGFLRQPTFDLGGGTTYRADFLVFHTDGTCEVIDTKGRITDAFTKAKKQVESRYPWIGEIKVVKAEDLR